jgi:hypothetical protein
MSEEYRNALPAGTEIDSYRIERVLGEGGFGITYLVNDLNLGKLYAIKELLPDGIAMRRLGDTSYVEAKSQSSEGDFAATRKYFIAEARVLAGMNHPAVVKVQRLMEANGTCYMVMDYIEGDTLGGHLKKQGEKLTGPSEFQQIFYPLMEGLDVLHGQGIIHRDIKPGNIMIRPDGSPVLLDFGAATQTQSQTVTITQMLSAGYSPFEQYTSRAKQGPYTDIYALGATMHKAITGNKPDDASDRVYGDTYQPLAQNPAYLESYGSALLGAVDAALSMQPEQRPQSIAEWWAVMSGGGVEVNTPSQEAEVHLGIPRGVPAEADASQGVAVGQDRLVTEPKGGKTWLVTILTAVLILIVVGAILNIVLSDKPAEGQREEVSEAQRSKGLELAEMERPAEKAVVQVKDTLDSLTDELVIQLNQYADIVLAVKDTATAREAVTNLNTVADTIEAIAARLDKIETPDEATNIAVDEKMKTASMAIKQKMQAAGEIMSNEEVAGILIPALQNFGKRMAEQEKVFMRFGSTKNKK